MNILKVKDYLMKLILDHQKSYFENSSEMMLLANNKNVDFEKVIEKSDISELELEKSRILLNARKLVVEYIDLSMGDDVMNENNMQEAFESIGVDINIDDLKETDNLDEVFSDIVSGIMNRNGE